MNTTTFYKKDGNISSRRHTLKIGKSSISFSEYPGGKGGVTFKSRFSSSRFNKSNQCIGSGLTVGKKTTYFGSNMQYQSNMTPFKWEKWGFYDRSTTI